jgi:hypothetical protein
MEILQSKKGIIIQEESSKPYLFGPNDDWVIIFDCIRIIDDKGYHSS